jgi:hypothetical protein
MGDGEPGVSRLAFDRYERKTHQEERGREMNREPLQDWGRGEGSLTECEVSNPFVHPFKVVILDDDYSVCSARYFDSPFVSWISFQFDDEVDD